MGKIQFSRRNFIVGGIGAAAGLAMLPSLSRLPFFSGSKRPRLPKIIKELNDHAAVKSDVVSIVKIKNGDIGKAVEEAIDLLGGIEKVTEGKNRIMLKPNLISHQPGPTTNPEVVEKIVQLMQAVGKDVFIGEGTATADGFNRIDGEDYRSKNRDLLKSMQQNVFDVLGYTQLAERYSIDLINLHLGEMKTVPVPDGLVFKELVLNKAMLDADMVCSVPMLKTHALSAVTLGMKNLFGIIPGSIYGSVRGHVHDLAMKVERSGTNSVIMDLFRTVTPGLVVIDGSVAMEGMGPLSGQLVQMDVIIAGTNAVATDMIGSVLMGFNPYKIKKFHWADKVGLSPRRVAAIEVRGEKVEDVWRKFKKPRVLPYRFVRRRWGYKNLDTMDAAALSEQTVS